MPAGLAAADAVAAGQLASDAVGRVGVEAGGVGPDAAVDVVEDLVGPVDVLERHLDQAACAPT